MLKIILKFKKANIFKRLVHFIVHKNVVLFEFEKKKT